MGKVEAREITLPSGESMCEPDDSSYKYLGILELDSKMERKGERILFQKTEIAT